MIELAERCPGLRSVCVSNCSHLTDQVQTIQTSLTRSSPHPPHWPKIKPHWPGNNKSDHHHANIQIQIQIQIQINEEILRVWWHWPPTAPAWSPSSAPDSLISLMLAFRWIIIIIIIVIRDVFEILSIYANIYIVWAFIPIYSDYLSNWQWYCHVLILNDAD